MKTTSLLLAAIGCYSSVVLGDTPKKASTPPRPVSQPPPPIYQAESSRSQPAAPPGSAYVYEQKLAGGRTHLVTPEQAQSVIQRFKEAHAKGASPRMLIFVNRALVDEQAGLKLSARSEKVESQRGSGPGEPAKTNETVTQRNTYRLRDAQEPSLTDRQTTRDVERLFGRPLRMAGASVVDQRIATQTLQGRPLETVIGDASSEQARRDREAISKIADIALEVLISSRQVTYSSISGERTVTVPDIQATAIRLSDAKVIGQATAADLLNRVGANARNYSVQEITEATALSLMEDMML